MANRILTNKELIQQLSGFLMKSEVEVVLDGKIHFVDKVNRTYVPETRDADGREIAGRNIVQIHLKTSAK